MVVEINSDKKSVDSFCDFDASQKTWELLKENKIKNLPTEVAKETSFIHSHLVMSTRNVLNIIKFYFKQINLDEELLAIKGTYWSLDKLQWKTFPSGGISVSISTRSIKQINQDTIKEIEEYLIHGAEPFFALRFLHRAKRENNPRYRWIDATIAAELAIKEFLIKLKPELEAVLIELPSPPLHKLYGSILETYTNQRSPKLKELNEGAHTSVLSLK